MDDRGDPERMYNCDEKDRSGECVGMGIGEISIIEIGLLTGYLRK